MPKRRHGFLDDIMLYLIENDHVHVWRSFRSKDIVICGGLVGFDPLTASR